MPTSYQQRAVILILAILPSMHAQGIRQLVTAAIRIQAEMHTYTCTLVCTTCTVYRHLHVEQNDKQQMAILVLWLPLHVL